MWQFNLLSIVREAVNNDKNMGLIIIFMMFIILFLVIYILSKNKTDKWCFFEYIFLFCIKLHIKKQVRDTLRIIDVYCFF